MAERASPAVVQIPGSVRIPEHELRWRYSSSSGPGGQHVNTSNTKVELVFDVESSQALPDELKRRIVERLGPVVRTVASDERSQLRNRRLAAERLGDRLADALEIPSERRPTRPSRGELARRRATRSAEQGRRAGRRWRFDPDD